VIKSGTSHTNLGQVGSAWGFPQIRDCLYFLSILFTGPTAALANTLYGTNDVFPSKEVPFGVSIKGGTPSNIGQKMKGGNSRTGRENVQVYTADVINTQTHSHVATANATVTSGGKNQIVCLNFYYLHYT